MGLIFDLDGTLINSINAHARAMKKALDIILGEDVVKMDFVRANIRYPSSIFFKKLNPNLDKKLDRKEVKRIMRLRDDELTMGQIKKINVFDGVFSALDILKKNNISYCIATSMNTRELSKFIPALKLNKISNVIINSHHLKFEKPNPYILNHSIKTMHMNKRHTYYVGDSPYDLIAAKRAKIHFIGVFNKKELGNHKPFYNDLLSFKLGIERNLDRFRD